MMKVTKEQVDNQIERAKLIYYSMAIGVSFAIAILGIFLNPFITIGSIIIILVCSYELIKIVISQKLVKGGYEP